MDKTFIEEVRSSFANARKNAKAIAEVRIKQQIRSAAKKGAQWLKVSEIDYPGLHDLEGIADSLGIEGFKIVLDGSYGYRSYIIIWYPET